MAAGNFVYDDAGYNACANTCPEVTTTCVCFINGYNGEPGCKSNGCDCCDA
jgi:hypothetical protein